VSGIDSADADIGKERTKIATATEGREGDIPGFMVLLRLVENEYPLKLRAIGLAG
jgi:hypothetical protein